MEVIIIQNLNKLWTVQYSVEQRAFHIETLAETLQLNRELAAKGFAGQYVPVAAFSTRKECSDFITECRREESELLHTTHNNAVLHSFIL